MGGVGGVVLPLGEVEVEEPKRPTEDRTVRAFSIWFEYLVIPFFYSHVT